MCTTSIKFPCAVVQEADISSSPFLLGQTILKLTVAYHQSSDLNSALTCTYLPKVFLLILVLRGNTASGARPQLEETEEALTTNPI